MGRHGYSLTGGIANHQMVSSDPCIWVFTPFKKILNICVFGCARSWLQLSGCSIFLATCRIFSWLQHASSYLRHVGSSSFLPLFSLQVVSDSSQSRGLQHTRLPCLSLHLPEFAQFMSTELVMPFNQWCQFLDPRSNPGPQPWKHRVLATGPPGKPWVFTSLCGPLRMKEGCPVKPTPHRKMAECDSEAGPGSHCFHLGLFGCLHMLTLREVGRHAVRTLKQPCREVHMVRSSGLLPAAGTNLSGRQVSYLGR